MSTGLASGLKKNLSQEDIKMLDRIYWRSFNVFAGFAGSAYAASLGYTYSIRPALDRFYPEQEKRAEAFNRHKTWYNITQNVGTFAMGLSASMEKENSENYGNYDTEAIVSIKTSLMGPMSGIGDALFWGIVRVIAAGIAINMSASGTLLAPIVFLLIYNIPSMICRYYMTYLGYTMGETFIKQAFESGLITTLTKCAGIVGLMMVGQMTANNVSFNLAITLPPVAEGAEPVAIQQYFDELLLGVLPLSITFICYYLLSKGVNQVKLIFGIMIIGIILGVLGVAG